MILLLRVKALTYKQVSSVRFVKIPVPGSDIHGERGSASLYGRPPEASGFLMKTNTN